MSKSQKSDTLNIKGIKINRYLAYFLVVLVLAIVIYILYKVYQGHVKRKEVERKTDAHILNLIKSKDPDKKKEKKKEKKEDVSAEKTREEGDPPAEKPISPSKKEMKPIELSEAELMELEAGEEEETEFDIIEDAESKVIESKPLNNNEQLKELANTAKEINAKKTPDLDEIFKTKEGEPVYVDDLAVRIHSEPLTRSGTLHHVKPTPNGRILIGHCVERILIDDRHNWLKIKIALDTQGIKTGYVKEELINKSKEEES